MMTPTAVRRCLTASVLLVGVVTCTGVLPSPLGEIAEYCQADNFAATCSDQQVILMQSASYGRMRQGRCVKGDYGHLGCSKDVLAYMDHKCSGLKECKFRVFDSGLGEQSACPEDIASYLEASFTCVDVVSADRIQCHQSKPVLLTGSSGIIASITAQDYGLGTVECPWTVRASTGQRVSVSLRYFDPLPEPGIQAPVGGATNRKFSGSCYELATVREGASSSGSGESRSVTTCDGRVRGEHEVFRSTSSDVTIQIVGRMALKTLGRFLLSYQAIGCADMIAPFNTTVVREGDRLMVKCNRSDHTWYLVCLNNSWHGETINCNHGDGGASKMRQMFDVSAFPYGILVVVAIGVALGVFCGGLLLACVVVYMKRERGSSSHEDQTPDYQCSVDGYYPARRSSVDHPAPLLSGSDDDAHVDQVSRHLADKTLGYTTAVHAPSCLTPCAGVVVGSGMPRLCHRPSNPGGVELVCADCGTEYEKRRTMLTAAAAAHGAVDVTMTRLPPGGTIVGTRDRLHHVYEMPHAV